MNIKIMGEYYEKACSFFKLDDNSWRTPQPEIIHNYKEMNEEYSIFEYVGTKYRKVILFISTEDIEGEHVVTISPVGGDNELSQEEHSEIMENIISAFDSRGIKWKEM